MRATPVELSYASRLFDGRALFSQLHAARSVQHPDQAHIIGPVIWLHRMGAENVFRFPAERRCFCSPALQELPCIVDELAPAVQRHSSRGAAFVELGATFG